jgi:cytochrome c oxidase assembly factor CtaG
VTFERVTPPRSARGNVSRATPDAERTETTPSFLDTFHPASAVVIVGIAATAAGYAVRWRRCHGLHGATEVRRRSAVLFGAGLVVLAIALLGPLDWLGERRLLAGHMVAHLLIVSVAPALLLIGMPRVAWPAAVMNVGPGPTAAACAVGAVGAVWLLHVPALLDSGLRNPWFNDLQHVGLLLAGLALAWPLAGPRPVAGLAAVAYLVVIELGVGVLGIWLTWFPTVVYDSYLEVPRLWIASAKTDQSVAGAILLVVAEPFVAVEVAILFIRALNDADDDPDDDLDDDGQDLEQA